MRPGWLPYPGRCDVACRFAGIEAMLTRSAKSAASCSASSLWSPSHGFEIPRLLQLCIHRLCSCQARCRHLWLTSKQHLGVHFNPAGLLSFGDALAFANAVQGPMPNYDAVAGAVGHGDGSRLAAPEAAPEMQEQMAQRGSITSRVPQKYLIQNQSGLRVYYWAGPVRLLATTCCSQFRSLGAMHIPNVMIGIPRANHCCW